MSTHTVLSLMLIVIICVQCDKLQITEEQNNGTEILPLSNYLKSLSTNQPTSFQLIEDNALSRSISVNLQTGNVTVKNRIDRESLCDPEILKCIIQLKFLMSPNYQTITVDIEILDINDNTPSWPQSFITRDIIEFDGQKFEDRNLYVDKALDPDALENGSVSYFLTERDGISENKDFKIRDPSQSSARLILYPLKVIDKERIESYNMVLLAKDKGSPRKTGSLNIKVFVLDKNDNSPIFEKQQYRNDALSETSSIGTKVLTLTATDMDSNENGKISYRIDDRVASKYFDIDNNGQLTVKGRLDYDNGIKSFRFNVIAFDNAPEAYRKSGECEVLINLKDENDENPEILIHVTKKDPVTRQPTIRENQETRNFVLAHVQVRDADFGGSDRVTCTLINNEKMRLEVSSASNNEYQIVALSGFDREEQSKEKVEITCLDQARNKAEKSIVFQITDENDNTPIFNTEFNFFVKENSSNPNTIVGDVKAEDKDEGKNSEIVYEIKGGNEYFRIDSNGRIYTKCTLDREENDRFNLTVLAKDGGLPPRTGTTTVIINVIDVNDWRPEFNATLYEFSVQENSRIGTIVGFVAATDRDTPSNTFIKYRIPASYLSKLPFKIVQNNRGDLVTWQRLDREVQSVYDFTVIAEDNGHLMSLTSTTKVKITITDTNDNWPIFSTNNYTTFSITMSESVGYGIGFIRAIDADSGDNSVVEYRMVKENMNKYFDLNVSTGKLSLASQVTRPVDKKLLIEACDKGFPRLCSGPLWVTIKVTKSPLAYNGEGAFTESQTDSRTFIFIICVLVILLLIILILVICAFLFKDRLCIPVPRSNSGDNTEINTTKNTIDSCNHTSINNESIQVTNYPKIVTPGSARIRNHTFESTLPFRDRQMSSDYQSIDGGSPRYEQRPVFNWDMVSLQPTLHERAEPLYAGHRSVKDYYYNAAPAPFPGSYCTYNASRLRSPCYGIRMTNFAKEPDNIEELSARDSSQKRYSSLLNFDSVMSNQDKYNYKSLRKTHPKASFV